MPGGGIGQDQIVDHTHRPSQPQSMEKIEPMVQKRQSIDDSANYGTI